MSKSIDNVDIVDSLSVNGVLTSTGAINTTGKITCTNTTNASSPTTGSIITSGGIGVAKDIYAAGDLTAYNITALEGGRVVVDSLGASGAPSLCVGTIYNGFYDDESSLCGTYSGNTAFRANSTALESIGYMSATSYRTNAQPTIPRNLNGTQFIDVGWWYASAIAYHSNGGYQLLPAGESAVNNYYVLGTKNWQTVNAHLYNQGYFYIHETPISASAIIHAMTVAAEETVKYANVTITINRVDASTPTSATNTTVATIYNTTLTAGALTASAITAANLTAGIYFVHMITSGGSAPGTSSISMRVMLRLQY